MTGPALTEEVIIRVRTVAAEEAKRVLAGITAEQQKAGRASSQSSGELQKLAQAQRQATADFRAGILTAQQYEKEMQRIRSEAIALRNTGLAPAGKELSAFSALMTNTATTAGQASRVLATMRTSMAQVASTALGAGDKLGALISTGLAPLGLSGVATVAVLAGTTAIAKGISLLGEAAEKARQRIADLVKANLEFVSGQNAVGGAAALLFQPGEGQDKNLLEQQTEAERRLAVARRGSPIIGPGGLVTGRIVDAAAVEAAEKELGALTQRVEQLKSALGEEKGGLAEKAEDALRAVRDLALQVTEGVSEAVLTAGEGIRQLQDQLGTTDLGAAFTPISPAQQRANEIAAKAGAARALLPPLAGSAATPSLRGLSKTNQQLSARATAALNRTGAPFDPRFIASQGGERVTAAAEAAAQALSTFSQRVAEGGNVMQAFSQTVGKLASDFITKQLGGGLFGGIFGGLAGGLLSRGIGAIFGGGGSNKSAAIPVQIADVAPAVMDDLSKRIIPPAEINIYRGSSLENAELARQRLREAEKRDRPSGIPRPGVGE